MEETTNISEIQKEFGRRDAIELKMNAKQECYWNIRLNFDDETQEYTDVVDKLEAIHKAMKERFL